MGKLKAIFALDSKNGFSRNGKLFTRDKEDLDHFKKLTQGNIIVMGWNTNQEMSIIGNGLRGLTGRENIVITNSYQSNEKYREAETKITHMSLESFRIWLLEFLNGPKDIFIIGGIGLLKEFKGEYDEIIVSRFYRDYDCNNFLINKDTNFWNWLKPGNHEFQAGKYTNFTVLRYCNSDYQEAKKYDMVHSPKHYQLEDGTEVIEHIKSLLGREQFLGYCKGNVIKYVARAGEKDSAKQDLEKAKTYIDFMIDNSED